MKRGCQRVCRVSTKEFIGENGKVKALRTVELEWKAMASRPKSWPERELPADPGVVCHGFTQSGGLRFEAFGVSKDARGKCPCDHRWAGCYATNVAKVWLQVTSAAGSPWRWAIREGQSGCTRGTPS